jgi:hypothetical protein
MRLPGFFPVSSPGDPIISQRICVALIPIFVAGMFFSGVAHDLKGSSITHADSVPGIRPMGLFDLQLAAVARQSGVAADATPGSIATNRAWGFSGRMQSSVRWSYKARQRPSRFAWADLIAAEVYLGNLSSSFSHQTGQLWMAYKFEFGLGGRLRISDDQDLGINLVLLKFARDNVSGNISGSGITGRYRYQRAMLEAGLDARQDRALGVAIDLSRHIPLQYVFTGRYLLKSGRNIGVTLETLPGTFYQDSNQYTKTWSWKVFYGIYF